MNKRIKTLQEHYNALNYHKALLSRAAVLEPAASALLSESYNLLRVIQNEIYEELQRLQQEESLQALLSTITIPEEKVADPVQNVLDKYIATQEDEEEKKDCEAADKIVAILQERANATEKPMRFNIELSQLGFEGVLKPKDSNGEEHF